MGCGGANSLSRLCRNRLLLIQSAFRSNGIYSFFMLQRMIQSQLFYTEAARRRQGRTSATKNGESTDFVTRYYGTVVPSSVPESTEWHVFFCVVDPHPRCMEHGRIEVNGKQLSRWRVQSKQLFAISDHLHQSNGAYCVVSYGQQSMECVEICGLPALVTYRTIQS